MSLRADTVTLLVTVPEGLVADNVYNLDTGLVPLALDCGKLVIFLDVVPVTFHDSPALLVRVSESANWVFHDNVVEYDGIPLVLFCGLGLALKELIVG